MPRPFVTVVPTRQRAVGGAMATLLLLGLLLLALAADSLLSMRATAAEAEPAGDHYTVSGTHVAIYNIAGEVRVEPVTGKAVEVWIARAGRDAGKLRVATGTIRDRQTLRVIYPSSRIVYREPGGWSSTSLHVDADGTFGDHGHKDWFGADRITINGRGGGLDAHADLRIGVPAGQKLDVYLGVGRAAIANVDGMLRVDVASASITSSGTRGSLVLDTGSGEIHVEDATGDVSLDTGSGDVELSNVRGGKLHVDTGSGSIHGSDLTAEALDMDTGSGSISITGVRSPTVVLDTGSGSVDVALAADVDQLSIDTGSGDVTVRVPRTLGAEVDVETGSGGIDTDIPFQLTRHSRDHVRGRIGDGMGRIYVETGSGSVRLAAYEGR